MRNRALASLTLALGLIQPSTGQASSQAAQAANATAKLPASPAKVEVAALAPADSLEFYVSPHGGHVAAVTQRGSRFVIVVDGAAGPPFDEIVGAGPTLRVFFSSDGTRYSYVARSGQEYVVMVDGKELVRLPVATTHWEANLRASFPDFTPGGKHTFFVASIERAGNTFNQLFFDGKPVPTTWGRMQSLVVSPDGDHYAYVAVNGANDNDWGLIVDGKPAGYKARDPQFTADGKHLFTRAASPPGVAILLDGKQFIRADDVQLFVPPVGYDVVAAVTRNAPDGNMQFLVVGGKRIPGSDAANITRVSFSPDGKHYAAECNLPQSKGSFVVVDGKKGQDYYPGFFAVSLPSGVSIAPNVLFSADSSKAAFIGMSGGKMFAVVNGEEFPTGYSSIVALSFGAGGQRVGFVGSNDSRDHSVVVDGKAAKSNYARADLAFSPDGSHYAYSSDGDSATATTSSYNRLVVDGVAEQGISIMPMGGLKANQGVSFVFSPDGKHVVHYGQIQADRRIGFIVDGKYVAEPAAIVPNCVTLTPDGRHVIWFSSVSSPDPRIRPFVVFVDGKASATFDGSTDNLNLLRTPGAWEMGADGVMTIIAHSGESVQRIRITPADSTSIDTFVGSAPAPSTRGR